MQRIRFLITFQEALSTEQEHVVFEDLSRIGAARRLPGAFEVVTSGTPMEIAQRIERRLGKECRYHCQAML